MKIDPLPYKSINNFAFEIDDGTGIFNSRDKLYTPKICGKDYEPIPMDVGQDIFAVIEEVVNVEELWKVKVLSVDGCEKIDVFLPERHFMFSNNQNKTVINIGQCQKVEDKYEVYLKRMEELVRSISDKQTINAPSCIYF